MGNNIIESIYSDLTSFDTEDSLSEYFRINIFTVLENYEDLFIYINRRVNSKYFKDLFFDILEEMDIDLNKTLYIIRNYKGSQIIDKINLNMLKLYLRISSDEEEDLRSNIEWFCDSEYILDKETFKYLMPHINLFYEHLKKEKKLVEKILKSKKHE